MHYSPKESSLYGTTRGVSLVRVLSLPCIIELKILSPTTQTNFRAFYSPKESALALTVWVPLVRVALISLVYWFQIFTTLRTVTFIWWGGRGVFLGQILTFSRVVWELFRKYLGIV